MKALWLVRPDLDASPGGDTTQIHETARALGARGVSVELSSVPRPSLDGHDIVHLFHLDRLWENLPHARRIAREQRPAVLSTIWWPTTEFDLAGRRGLQGLAARRLGSSYAGFKVWQRSLLRFVRQGLRPSQRPIARFDRAAQELLDAVRVLLPNSASEAREIMTRFGERTPVVVVPNAADIEFWTPAVEPLERSGIVCVGRIEPRKNQLALIEAVRELDVDLTLIGRAGGYARRYEAQCRSAASARVRFAGQLDRERVRDHLRRARVHVCPSWYETPGLASLEAALCGAPIVVTPGGCTDEYFSGWATFSEGIDAGRLRAALRAAMQAPPTPEAAHDLRQRFSWSAAAEATQRAYEQALSD